MHCTQLDKTASDYDQLQDLYQRLADADRERHALKREVLELHAKVTYFELKTFSSGPMQLSVGTPSTLVLTHSACEDVYDALTFLPWMGRVFLRLAATERFGGCCGWILWSYVWLLILAWLTLFYIWTGCTRIHGDLLGMVRFFAASAAMVIHWAWVLWARYNTVRAVGAVVNLNPIVIIFFAGYALRFAPMLWGVHEVGLGLGIVDLLGVNTHVLYIGPLGWSLLTFQFCICGAPYLAAGILLNLEVAFLRNLVEDCSTAADKAMSHLVALQAFTASTVRWRAFLIAHLILESTCLVAAIITDIHNIFSNGGHIFLGADHVACLLLQIVPLALLNDASEALQTRTDDMVLWWRLQQKPLRYNILGLMPTISGLQRIGAGCAVSYMSQCIARYMTRVT